MAFFSATGFFFNDSTYYKNIKVLPPASDIKVSDTNEIISQKRYFEWYYNPLIRDVEEASEVLKIGFEKNILTAIHDKKVILPLSGGIDSRCIAAAIPNGMTGINSYSYEFEGGIKEVRFAKAIAKLKNLPFNEFVIPKGYLWNKIDELTKIVHYDIEYTHSRQIAVMDELEKLGDIFLLGHGGEIFKAAKVKKDLSDERIVDHLYDMYVSAAGQKLGKELWDYWGLEGNFREYVTEVFNEQLKKINIKEVNPKLRAFTFCFIAHRKNHVNINIFERQKEIYLPFLQQNVLNGICNVHEDILTDRKVQIDYIKRKSPEVAKVPWQDYYPLNLYDYKKYYKKSYLPKRTLNYLKRKLNERLSGERLIIRNWENQLLGAENDKQLQNHLFNDAYESGMIPRHIVRDMYERFRYTDNKAHVRPVSTLITLMNFQKDHNKAGIKNDYAKKISA